MTVAMEQQKKLHFELTNVGMRAQATAAGMVQLCRELHRAGILDNDALERIKSAIADDIDIGAPRSVSCVEYRRDVKARLDRLFTGEEKVGNAEGLAFPPSAHGDQASL